MARKRTSELLLKAANKTIDGCISFAECFIDPYGKAKGKYDNKERLADVVTNQAFRNAALRLRRNGCLERITKKGNTFYKITEKGRNKIEKKFFDKDLWDGKWRIVVFDIPENHKKTREILRRILKFNSFKQFQKSVWVSPFDVLQEIEDFTETYVGFFLQTV